MQSAIVIGGNHHNTLGVIQSLGKKKINSIVIFTDNSYWNFVSKSRYVEQSFFADNEEKIIHRLLLLKSDGKKVVICCCDFAASIIDQNRQKLIDYYYLPGIPKQGVLTKYMDKGKMAKIASEYEIISPQYTIATKTSSIKDIIFPCICKPISSLVGNKSDINVCMDINQLNNAINNSNCKSFQIQQYIRHDHEFQLIGLSLREGDEVIIPGKSICIRPCPATNTGYLLYKYEADADVLIHKCKELLKAIRYSGLFSIEFLHGYDGIDYFLEINFRNDGNAICVTESGINLPYIWAAFNLHEDYSNELVSTRKNIYLMPGFLDLKNFVLTGKVGPFQWIKDVIKVNKFSILNINDPIPFITYLFSMATKKLTAK